MPADNLENRQNNESTQESWENLAKKTLNNPKDAMDVVESMDISWDLNELIDKEIKDVNKAKNLIKQKAPDLNIDWRKDYQIINQAKRIQKEMQSVRRFENRKWNFETKTNNPETVLKSFSYKEDGKDIIITINGSQEIRYKKVFSTWNEKFDNKLNPQLKNYLDSKTYSESLYNLSFFLENASSFCVDWWHHTDLKESDFDKIAIEMRSKANDLMNKNHIKWFFDNPNNVSDFIKTFKEFSIDELNKPGFINAKMLISKALSASNDYTFSTWRDFTHSEKLSCNYRDKAITAMNRNPSCNMEITSIDTGWIHLKNTITWKETVFNADTFKKAKAIETERKSQREYIENKEKEIKWKLWIAEGSEITLEDMRRIETEMLFDAFTTDNKMFNILYNRVAESNARWYPNTIRWEEISLLLKKFDINENINWRCSINLWRINWKQAIQFDFWSTQICFSYWEQPKITHKKVSQEEIHEQIKEDEKSPNYKRALNIIKTSKDSWIINLSNLNLSSKEVWNLFMEANLKDISNLEISLSWNRISTIPSVLFQQKWIRSLNLSRNLITEISPDIFRGFDKNNCNLENLSFDWNNINKISEELFKNIDSLKSFNISSNEDLNNLSDSIWNLKNLQEFNISGTWLEYIPASIVNCKNLESIYAGHCKLMDIPNGIWELVNLKDLYLWNNKISKIPDLSKLEHLEHLDLYYTDINSIPELSFENLKSIDFVGCDKISSQVQTFKDFLNKKHPEIKIHTKLLNNSWINTWEDIKETYFSWYNNGEILSWNPNEFFSDNEQYEQIRLVAESTSSGLSKAKKELKIEDNSSPIFYSERKRSDWTISMHVFTKRTNKD